ncbi:MAG: hypothetical protein GEU95_08045 [Rhizobiales bacterium]|nr:hypothetical protein [Hyphomicrobiales bacterium]
MDIVHLLQTVALRNGKPANDNKRAKDNEQQACHRRLGRLAPMPQQVLARFLQSTVDVHYEMSLNATVRGDYYEFS